jgi:hypothetical protein
MTTLNFNKITRMDEGRATSELNRHVEQQTENWDDDFEDAQELLKSSTTEGRRLGRLGGKHLRRQRLILFRREGGKPYRHGLISTSRSPTTFHSSHTTVPPALPTNFLLHRSQLSPKKPLSKSSTTVHLTALYFRFLLQRTRTKSTAHL